MVFPTYYRPLVSWLYCLLIVFSLSGISQAGKLAGDAAELYEKALIATNNDEPKAAIIHLKNALKIDSRYIAAHILLGKLYLQGNNGGLAEKELKKADELGADSALTVIPLARAYLQQNKYQSLVENIFPLGFEAKIAAQLFTLQGKAYIELKSLEDASDALTEATRLDPDSAEPRLGLATIALQSGQFSEAQNQLSLARDLDPENTEAYFIEASIHHAQGRFQQALKSYSKVIEQVPDHLAARMTRAGLYLDLQQHQQALEDIQAILTTYPRDPRAAYLKAVLLARMGDDSASAQALQDAGNIVDSLPAETISQHSPSLMLAGLIKFSLGEYEKAQAYLESYVKSFPNNPSARKLLGATQIRQKDYATAIRTLEPALNLLADDYKLQGMLGTAYMQTGRHDLAATMFEQALNRNDSSAALRQQQAFNNLARNQSELATEQLVDVFQSEARQNEAGLVLTLLHIQNRKFKQALKTARQLVTQSPDNPTLLNLLASVQIANGQTAQARQNLDTLVSKQPDFIGAQLNLARLDGRSGDLAAAQTRLRDLLERKPGAVIVMIELGRLAHQAGDRQTALRWLEKAYSSNSKSIPAITHLVDLYLAYDQVDDAIRVADAADAQFPDNLKVLDALGRAYLAQGNYRQAQMMFQRLSVAANYNSKLLYRIAKLQLRARDPEKAVWSLQKAIDGDRKNLDSYVLLTELLIQRDNLTLAKETVDKILVNFPNRAQGPGLMGDIYLQQGKISKAIGSYRTALKRQDSSQGTVRLANAYRLQNKPKTARKTLLNRLKKYPDDVVAREALAEHYLADNNWQKAAEHYEIVLSTNPDRAMTLNNLAVIYTDADPEKALDYAQKAHRLLPNASFSNDTLGWLLVQAGQAKEGIRYLRTAHARQASNPEIHYHLAVALHQLGRHEEAQSELALALENGESFNGIEQARALQKAFEQQQSLSLQP